MVHTMKHDWKYYLGITLFVYCWLPYVFLAVVLPFLPVSDVEAVSIATGLVMSAETSFLISIALLGKPFIHLLKAKVRIWFLRKDVVAAPRPVGRVRHYIGATLMLVSFIVPYYLTELALFVGFVEKHGHRDLLILLIVGDALFIASFFILGGDFWGRLKTLFEWPGEPIGADS